MNITKFVYHDTGDWIRSDCNTAAIRDRATVEEYNHLDEIDNQFVRDTFAWMLDNGMTVTSSGSSVFQIRGIHPTTKA